MHRFFSAGLIAALTNLTPGFDFDIARATAELPPFISTSADDLVWTRRKGGQMRPNSKRARQRRHRQARRRTLLRRRRAHRRAA